MMLSEQKNLIGNCYIGTKPSECNDLPAWSRSIFIYSQHSEKSLVQLPAHSRLEQVSANIRRLFEKSSATTAGLDETYLKDCWRCVCWSRWVTAEHTLLPCQRLGYCQSNTFGLHWPKQQTISEEIETGDSIKRRWQRACFIRLYFMEQRFHRYFHSLHFKFPSSHETITSLVTCSLSQDLAWRRGQVTALLSDLEQKQGRPAFFRTFSSWLFPLQN